MFIQIFLGKIRVITKRWSEKNEKIVEVNHVSKTYGRLNNKTEVLDNISFTVDEGEFVGIMGPSGAGKSTLLNVLSSIILPTAGIVRIAGQDILKMRDNQLSDFRRNEMGFIFQSFNLIDTLNVKDNILLPLAVEKVSLEEMDKRLLHVTSILGIQELLSAYPPEISVGQKQRVAAARALITNPKIIFADEPTGSLDSKSATELLKYLAEINLHDDATILMVTHDPYTASFAIASYSLKTVRFSQKLFVKDHVRNF